MKKIKKGFIYPSSALTIPRTKIGYYLPESDKKPEVGDLAYGKISYIGQHNKLENREGRIHTIQDGTRAVFVFGNRYAPDYYEGFVPKNFVRENDLMARSGIIGNVKTKSSLIADPSKVEIFGYICDKEGNILNTKNFSKIIPKRTKKTRSRAKLILNIGSSMNSGKSATSAACCWALSTMGYSVRGTKITGTASLKDILLMEDNGASTIADFSYMGYPSTYMLEENELQDIFDKFDLKYGNNPKNYWVVEIADGILQRETAMLLKSEKIQTRIHKLIYSCHDALSGIGGIKILKEKFKLNPDAISGVCSSSPLGINELQNLTKIPIFNNLNRDLKELADILL